MIAAAVPVVALHSPATEVAQIQGTLISTTVNLSHPDGRGVTAASKILDSTQSIFKAKHPGYWVIIRSILYYLLITYHNIYPNNFVFTQTHNSIAEIAFDSCMLGLSNSLIYRVIPPCTMRASTTHETNSMHVGSCSSCIQPKSQ